jgi:hypothetical protein
MLSTDVTLADLNDAEQRVIKMIEATAATIETILHKLSGSDANGFSDVATNVVEERTKTFIETVFKLQELFRSLLTGPDEKFSYRPFERNIYGFLADFDCAADSIVLVSERVQDLRTTLERFLGKSDDKIRQEPTDDNVMRDA